MKFARTPSDFYPLLRSILRFPTEPYNFLDVAARSMREEEPANRLTDGDSNAHLYIVGSQVLSKQDYHRVVPEHVIISSAAKVTPSSFPAIIVSPVVTEEVQEEYRMTMKHIKMPDFESKAKRNIRVRRESEALHTMDIDLDMPATEADKKSEQEELEKEVRRLRKEAHEALMLQDFELSAQRNEIAYLQSTGKLLAPGGVMLFMTHRALLDKPVLQYIQTTFTDVNFYEIDEDENHRILVIGKRRRVKTKYDASIVNEWSRYRFGTEKEPMPVLGDTDDVYVIPSVSRTLLTQFRIGPVSTDEVFDLMRRSKMIDRVVTEVLPPPNYEPTTPSPLHKGHLVQLLTSGMIDTYIGEGQEQHLVKGSSVRLANTTTKEGENEDEEITTIRDFYTVNLKLLLPDGTFKRII